MSTLKSGFNLWLPLEKLIGVILLFWSGFVLYTMVSTIATMFSSGYVATQNITIASIAAHDHFIIIVSVLCLFGSCMLLYKDKTGWLLCVVASFMFGVNLFMSSHTKSLNSKLPYAEHYKSYGIVAILFFIIFIVLLLKPIYKRYQPTFKTWLLISGIILLLIVDKMVFK